MTNWRCLKGCGACCYLEPSERPGLEEYLTPEELALYYSLVGADGWCINFDHSTRECRIYEERPEFCRVKPYVFERLYGVTLPEFEDFAIDCCLEQIESVYGETSLEMERYTEQVLGVSETL